MVNLVLKDIMIQKKSFLTAVMFAFIMVIALQGSLGPGAYMMGAMGIVFVLIAGAFMYDEKSRGDILINSLPLKRKEIVKARYLSLVVFSIIAVVLVYAAGTAVRLVGFPVSLASLNIPELSIIFILLIFMFSIYIPIYFKYGYVKSRIVNLVLYITLFGVSGVITGVRKAIVENPKDSLTIKLLSILNNIPDWMIGPVILLVLLLLLLISMSLSIRFYAKREF